MTNYHRSVKKTTTSFTSPISLAHHTNLAPRTINTNVVIDITIPIYYIFDQDISNQPNNNYKRTKHNLMKQIIPQLYNNDSM